MYANMFWIFTKPMINSETTSLNIVLLGALFVTNTPKVDYKNCFLFEQPLTGFLFLVKRPFEHRQYIFLEFAAVRPRTILASRIALASLFWGIPFFKGFIICLRAFLGTTIYASCSPSMG